jgi:RNA polymerase sigma-70 factor (ECF subfamily)
MSPGQNDLTGSITLLLRKARTGDRAAQASLMDRVYPELRTLAQSMLSGKYRPTGTGEGTGLVHDACCRLLQREQLDAEDRRHFFFLFGRAMQDELAEHARSDLAQKRGGHHTHVTLDNVQVEATGAGSNRVEVREAIDKFRTIDPEGAAVAQLRCLMGLSLDSTAAAMGLTVPIVRRHWKYAKAWLQVHLSEVGHGAITPDPDSEPQN